MTKRMLHAWLVCAGFILVSGCSSQHESGRCLTGGCVVTAHPLATAAAAEVLRSGGNAVDAAVAAAFTLAVVEPYSSGLGGGGFFVLHDAATDRQFALDARETAPAAATRDMYLVDGVVDPLRSRDGAHSVAVPSLVRGLEVLHREHGRLPWAQLIEAAERLAREGFPVDARLVEHIVEERERFDAESKRIFLFDNEIPGIGDVLRQVDLAKTLHQIRSEGADGFHRGEVAERIVAAIADAGGSLTLDDLAGSAPVWRDPIRGRFRNWTVIGMPPPSSGGLHLQQMLDILNGWSLRELTAAERIHVMAQAMTFAYADRSRWLGDPDFVDVPVDMLLDPARTDSLQALIGLDSIYPRHLVAGVGIGPHESDDTTHLSIIDADGNAVAATLTINLSFGSGMVAAGTGVILNDEMDDFAAAPGVANAFGLLGSEANAVAPGKRPLSSMTPTLVLGDAGVHAVCGSPGGSRIITATLQALLNVLVDDLDPVTAVSRPRIHHQWSPPDLFFETGAVDGLTQALEDMGHVLTHRQTVGNVQLIVVDESKGIPIGASDPRGIGAAAFIARGDDGR